MIKIRLESVATKLVATLSSLILINILPNPIKIKSVHILKHFSTVNKFIIKINK